MPARLNDQVSIRKPARLKHRTPTWLFAATFLSLGLLQMIQTSFVGAAMAQDAPLLKAPLSFADLAAKVRPAVVGINVRRTTNKPGSAGAFPDIPQDFHSYFEKKQPEQKPSPSVGSGFLISPDGYVASTYNVITDKPEEIEVVFNDGMKYRAKLIGSDPRADLALLKITSPKTDFPYLEFAKTQPRIGDLVLAVGNPFGLNGTAALGMISNTDCDIGMGPYDYIQIDASINRGNSGGPSASLDGKVVGIIKAIYSPNSGSVGIAFAIPASTAYDVLEKLKATGKASSGWLGIQMQNVNEKTAESLGLGGAQGALVAKILPEGPATASNLKEQDVILKVDGKVIKDSRDLER